MNINEARLVSFVTAVGGKELDNYEIERFSLLIKDCQPEQTVSLATQEQVTKEVTTLLYEMNKGYSRIEAIKAHRTLTGWGLKESKNEIERYWVQRLDKTD